MLRSASRLALLTPGLAGLVACGGAQSPTPLPDVSVVVDDAPASMPTVDAPRVVHPLIAPLFVPEATFTYSVRHEASVDGGLTDVTELEASCHVSLTFSDANGAYTAIECDGGEPIQGVYGVIGDDDSLLALERMPLTGEPLQVDRDDALVLAIPPSPERVTTETDDGAWQHRVYQDGDAWCRESVFESNTPETPVRVSLACFAPGRGVVRAGTAAVLPDSEQESRWELIDADAP